MRKIVHIDMDAFFASVEIRDNPRLRGRPVIVGGLPGTRGVVSTASYEARKYGVHSAMSSTMAASLCPHAVFIRPRIDVYSDVSKQLMAIFHDYTCLVEPMSIDEAYLDVTENLKGIQYASRVAKEIKRRIFRETGGLTASAGVSYNKFLAKMASDIRKPDGLTVITPDAAPAFLASLPIEKFHGVGRATAKKMHALGISSGADLLKKSLVELSAAFGVYGQFYYDIARGVDEREVCVGRERKSLGTEETFRDDVDDMVTIVETIKKQSAEVASELVSRSLKGRTVTLKIKYFDFRSVTRSRSLDEYVCDSGSIASAAVELLKKTSAGTEKVRLVGVTVSGFPEDEPEGPMLQLEFDFMKLLGRSSEW